MMVNERVRRSLDGLSRPVLNSGGTTHFVEYLVLALVVLVATVYFFETELRSDTTPMRTNVKTAFESLCNKIAGVECAP